MTGTSSAASSAVTVLIASHNRLEFLQAAVASALAQDYEPVAVVVIDDGSAEPTRAWLREQAAAEPRLTVVLQEHSGVAVTRQNGLDHVETPFVCILDSDDRLLPHAVSRIMQEFSAHPDTDLVYVNNQHVFTDGRTAPSDYPRYPDNRTMMRAVFLRPRVPLKHSGTTMRVDTVRALGGYDRELQMKIDLDLFLRFLVGDRALRLVEEPLVMFHVHGGSLSRARFRGLPAWMTLLRRYGPRPPLRWLYALWRIGIEVLKAVYTAFRWS
jgi:glycosyltransferase involved in cell wall biosynthesis